MFRQTKTHHQAKKTSLNHLLTTSYVSYHLTYSLHALEHQSHHETTEESHRMHSCVVFYKEK